MVTQTSSDSRGSSSTFAQPMLRGAALLAFAQLATAFREVSDPSRPCSERAGCQACLSRDAPPSVLNHMEVCSWCATTQRCTAVAPTAAETAAACPEGLLLKQEGCKCAALSYTCEGCLSDPSCAFVPRYRGESSSGGTSARARRRCAAIRAAVARGPSNLRPENLRVALGLDVFAAAVRRCCHLARVASAAPDRAGADHGCDGRPATAPVPTTVVMGGPVTAPADHGRDGRAGHRRHPRGHPRRARRDRHRRAAAVRGGRRPRALGDGARRDDVNGDRV